MIEANHHTTYKIKRACKSGEFTITKGSADTLMQVSQSGGILGGGTIFLDKEDAEDLIKVIRNFFPQGSVPNA